MGTRGSFLGDKAAREVKLTENVNLYIHSPIWLHGEVLN
jgi:hypothetical protein